MNAMAMRTKWISGRRLAVLALLAVAAVVTVGGMRGCASTIPARNPVGEIFPTVEGETLAKEPVELPSSYAGRPTVILVGYEQRAQFDIDRWLLGLLDAEVDAAIVELPTIPGLLPTIASGWIDDGMRAGIPQQDWGAVVTLYGNAAKPVAELTGTDRGQLTRVLLLDGEGRVVWFDDEGYSARRMLELREAVNALHKGE